MIRQEWNVPHPFLLLHQQLFARPHAHQSGKAAQNTPPKMINKSPQSNTNYKPCNKRERERERIVLKSPQPLFLVIEPNFLVICKWIKFWCSKTWLATKNPPSYKIFSFISHILLHKTLFSLNLRKQECKTSKSTQHHYFSLVRLSWKCESNTNQVLQAETHYKTQNKA